ncbi:hypothetical protein EV586_109109 [Tumebacillus sp. BK434]|uniref:hypothetical protein n=1 Tax=Tumebacillus sp. BK434 TaxID=2512169 RepID=UPI00104D2E96|nr:hypothetical protein [Tumebacillus sp. BK434]TCP52626.1 hypothetical protein EV586_109109 [Tumebacillus sp. BK434]
MRFVSQGKGSAVQQAAGVKQARTAGAALHPILQMQQQLGNRRTGQLLRGQMMQAKMQTAQLMRIRNTGEEVSVDDYRVYELTAARWLKAIADGEVEATQEEIEELQALHDSLQDDTGSEFDPTDMLNPDQQELLDQMRPVFEARVAERKGKKLPGKMVQGDLLEHYTSTQSHDMEIEEVNANEYHKNIPAIDHLRDHSTHLFVQDKLHLSAHTAKIETYRAHYAKRGTMGANLVKAMAADGKRGDHIRALFSDAINTDSWVHKDTLQTIYNKVSKYRKDDEISEIKDDDDLIELAASNIAFSVPSDIWEALYQEYLNGNVPENEMRSYIRLDMNTDEFIQVMALLQDVAAPWDERNPKEDDEEYKA